jgi:phytanoyl-CoA hydroxylase
MTPHTDLFQTDGFVVLPGCFGPEQLAPLADAARRLAAEHDFELDRAVFRTDDGDRGRDERFFASAREVRGFLEADALGPSGELCVPRAEALNKIGHALHDLVPEFRTLARSAAVREAYELAGLLQPLLVQTMVIFKQPRIGGEVRWHQDASYLRTRPSSVIGLWLALEDAHRDNGCLWMVPGAHRSPLREEYTVDWETRSGSLRTLDETPWPGLADAVPLEVEAGSLVVFHDHMPHRSDANRSGTSRLAITLHAHDASSEWLADNWLQRGDLPDFTLA